MTIGISNKPLSPLSNAIISIFNAFGAFISATGGHVLGELAPLYATLFAAVLFSYLSADELISHWRRRSSNPQSTSTLTLKSGNSRDAVRIAVPMTLNNLAGGAAGGAAGIDAKTTCVAALVASFCMMKMGHLVGKHLMTTVGNKIDTGLISGAIFACLAVMQLVQLL